MLPPALRYIPAEWGGSAQFSNGRDKLGGGMLNMDDLGITGGGLINAFANLDQALDVGGQAVAFTVELLQPMGCRENIEQHLPVN
jgi:hypothetical protein